MISHIVHKIHDGTKEDLISQELWQLLLDMSGISHYQNVFRVAKRDATNNGTRNGTQPQITKRNRQSTSCLPCRNRRLEFFGILFW